MAERHWIEHDGTHIPVQLGWRIEARLRNGDVQRGVVGPVQISYRYPNGGLNPMLWAVNGYVKNGGRAVVAWRRLDDPEAEARRERYAAIFDDMIKTAPLDLPERQRVPAEQIHNQYEQGDL